MQVIWINSAEADLQGIFDNLIDKNPAAASKTAAAIVASVEPLRENPRYGTSIPELPGLSKIVIRPT